MSIVSTSKVALSLLLSRLEEWSELESNDRPREVLSSINRGYNECTLDKNIFSLGLIY